MEARIKMKGIATLNLIIRTLFLKFRFLFLRTAEIWEEKSEDEKSEDEKVTITFFLFQMGIPTCIPIGNLTVGDHKDSYHILFFLLLYLTFHSVGFMDHWIDFASHLSTQQSIGL